MQVPSMCVCLSVTRCVGMHICVLVLVVCASLSEWCQRGTEEFEVFVLTVIYTPNLRIRTAFFVFGPKAPAVGRLNSF